MKIRLLKKLRSRHRIILDREGGYWTQHRTRSGYWQLGAHYKTLEKARSHVHSMIRLEGDYIRYKNNHKIEIVH